MLCTYLVHTQSCFPPPPSLNKGTIIETKNHKITGKSRLEGNSGDHTLQLSIESRDQVIQSPIKPGLGYFPWGIFQQLSRQLIPTFNCSHSNFFFSRIKTKFPLEQLVTIASCHVSMHPCEDLLLLCNSLPTMGGLWLGPPCTAFSLGWAVITSRLLLSLCLVRARPDPWLAHTLPALHQGPFRQSCPPVQSVPPCTAPCAYPYPGAGDLSLLGWLHLCCSKASGSLTELGRFLYYLIYWCKRRSVVAGMVLAQCVSSDLVVHFLTRGSWTPLYRMLGSHPRGWLSPSS